MLVRIEVEFDDIELSIKQEERLVYAAQSSQSGVAVRTMGTAVGKMLVALGAGSDITPAVLMSEFKEAVVRAARSAEPTKDHTCDGVSCC